LFEHTFEGESQRKGAEYEFTNQGEALEKKKNKLKGALLQASTIDKL